MVAALAVTAALRQAGSALAAPVATAAELAQAGLPDCVVPDLRGKTLPQIEYQRILGGVRDGNPMHYCRLGTTRTRHPGRPTHGQPLVVVSQSPLPGVTVPFFTAVSLVLDPARRPTKPGPCHLLVGSEAVARFPDMAVYRTATDVPDGPNNHLVRVSWRACVRSSGERRTIYVGDLSQTLSHFVVGGLHVAFTVDATSRDGDIYRSIVLVDLTTGRQSVFRVPGVGISYGPNPPSPGDPPPLDGVAAIVLNAKGFIAWVVTDPTGGSSLYVHDSQGTRLVDQSAGIAIANLRLSGDTLAWTNGGMAGTATLA